MPSRAPFWLLPLLVGTGLLLAAGCGGGPRYANPYPVAEDDGRRAPPSYIARRAWVQLTRDEAATRLPRVVPLDLAAMAREPFAVAWLGHSALLVRAGSRWILIDPTFSEYVGPVQGFGPKRLTPLPFAPGSLPRIDLVLTSHDHYDHLDHGTIRQLMRQPGGPPRFLAGLGLAPWFAELGAACTELAWWDRIELGDVRLTFVPAMHGSGRGAWGKHRTLWGGWVVEHAGQRFTYTGDTAWHPELFAEIRRRTGAPDLAAIPIGAYTPRAWMRFEHTDPAEALLVQRALGATTAFGVHWATFQLGDEEPYQPALDLLAAHADHPDLDVRLLRVGDHLPVRGATRPAHLELP